MKSFEENLNEKQKQIYNKASHILALRQYEKICLSASICMDCGGELIKNENGVACTKCDFEMEFVKAE